MRVNKIFLFLILVCLVFGLFAGICAFAADQPAYLGDTVVFGTDSTHAVTADSQSTVKSMTTMRAGEYTDEKYTVQKLAAKTGEVSFDMAISGDDVTLEFEEVHNKSGASYGYYVNVDGTDVFLRVGAETSVGPLHFFVKVPSELTAGKSKIRVTLRNVSDAPVSLNRAWAHSNLDTLLAEEGIDGRMPVMLVNGDFFNAEFMDKETMRAALLSYMETFGDAADYQSFSIGYCVEVAYMRQPDERIYELIDQVVDLSRELNIPMAINFNSWWGGLPNNVPDGKGGFFNDLEYQMLDYAPLNSNGRGYYQTTSPNVWGSAWLSMNSDHLNEVRLSKYRKFCKYISQKLSESRVLAGDAGIPEFSVFIENEPQYWPEFIFTTNEPHVVCDSSQMFVEDMKENYGVDFDPTDWLDEEEQAALFYNLNDYAADSMRAAADGAGTDPVVVHGDMLTLPDYQLMDNFYTHQFDANDEGRVISPWDTYETAITKNGHVGLEGYGITGTVSRRNIGAHTAARGKFTAVNIECSAAGTAISPLKDYYAAGAHYGTLYNVSKAAQPLLAEMDQALHTEEYTEPFEGRELARYEVDETTDFTPDGFLISTEGMGVNPFMRNYLASPQTDDFVGTMTFCVDNKNKPLENGLAVMMNGACRTDVDPTCKVEVYAGSDLENLTLVPSDNTVNDAGVTVDISDYIDKTSPVAYFQIRITTSGYNRGYCGVYSVRAAEPFGETLGHTNGFNYTLAETRLNNLLVTFRADTERMLAEQTAYAGSHPDYIAAQQLYAQGKYKSAKQLLLGTASLTMPAKFTVIENGKLGDYPVEVEVENKEVPVVVTLREVGETVRFELGAQQDTNVTLHFSGMAGRYELTQDGDVYTLAKCGSGACIESDGVVTVTLPVGRPEKTYPRQFTGFIHYPYLTQEPEGKILISSHDPSLTDYSMGKYFVIADDAEILRGPVDAACGELEPYPREKLKELQWGERADVTLNDAGEIAKLEIRYGLVSGTITKFTEAQLPEMIPPYMEVTEDGTGKTWRFKVDTLTQFNSSKTGGAGSFVEANPGVGIGFKEGHKVNVSYLPLKAGDEEAYYATEIFENYTTVIDEDLNDASYRDSIYSENNVQILPLDENNLDSIGLAAVGSSGSVVWKITSDKPIEEVVVNYAGRAILGSNVEIQASPNGYIYDEISSLEEIFAHDFNHVFSCYTNDPSIVGGNTVYIRAKFDVQAGTTWGFLNSIQIQIKD